MPVSLATRPVHIIDRTNNRDLGKVIDNGGGLVVSQKKTKLHDGILNEEYIFEKLDEDSVELSKTVGFVETRSPLTAVDANMSQRPPETNAYSTYNEATLERRIDSFENLRNQF